ncbi:hypothetical protein OPQ81_001153 [Rhizoctonia solani]|nr:hypothetical protein OPQ81_001153 [Rhizoctonia solani]
MSNNRGFPFTKQKKPQFLVAEHEGDKATIPRDPDYKNTIEYINQVFPRSRRAAQIILTAQLEEFGGVVEITEELWFRLLPSLILIGVELDFSRWERIKVSIQGRPRYFEVDLTTETVEDLKNKVQATEGIPSQEQHFWFAGDQSNSDYNFELWSGKLAYWGVDSERTILVLNEIASAELAKARSPGGCSMGLS